MRVAIVHNVPVPDSIDSLDVLDEARFVADTLGRLKIEHAIIPAHEPLEDLFPQLEAYAPDVVFNLIEEPIGELSVHAATLMLGRMGYKYTGTGPDGIQLSTDKTLSKTLMLSAGIPTPQYAVYNGRELPDLSGVPAPWIVKPAWEDASVGITDDSVFHDGALLLAALPAIHGRHRQPLLVERLLEGREVCVPMLEIDGKPFCLPPSEMQYIDWPQGKPLILGYDAKWTQDSLEYNNSVRNYHPDGLRMDELKAIALRCWDAFSLGGYARVDMRLDREGRAYVIEVNPNPCISPDAGYVASLEEAGYSHEWFIQAVLGSADA